MQTIIAHTEGKLPDEPTFFLTPGGNLVAARDVAKDVDGNYRLVIAPRVEVTPVTRFESHTGNYHDLFNKASRSRAILLNLLSEVREECAKLRTELAEAKAVAQQWNNRHSEVSIALINEQAANESLREINQQLCDEIHEPSTIAVNNADIARLLDGDALENDKGVRLLWVNQDTDLGVPVKS